MNSTSDLNKMTKHIAIYFCCIPNSIFFFLMKLFVKATNVILVFCILYHCIKILTRMKNIFTDFQHKIISFNRSMKSH